jgi:hypothetical protein
MRSPCALLIAAFLITGCGARKLQPVIVRETVTLRGQRGPTPQPDARQATAPVASSRPAAADLKTPPRNRDEVGISGLTEQLPQPGDATITGGGDRGVPQPVDSAAPQPPPSERSVGAESRSAASTAQRAGRSGSSLLIVWVALAAALCAWGLHLRRDRGARAGDRPRRVA